jgi:hypothetical protein
LFVFSGLETFSILQTFSLLKSANQVMTCVEFGCYFGSGRVFRRPTPLPSRSWTQMCQLTENQGAKITVYIFKELFRSLLKGLSDNLLT